MTVRAVSYGPATAPGRTISEKSIEKSVCDFAATLGWLRFKFVSPNNRAVPDDVFFRAGRTVFVEFKAPGKTASKLQEREHEKLRAAGFVVVVIDCTAAGRKFFLGLGAV